MNQVITGAPFGDGDIELYMDTSSGDVVLEKGHLDDADVTVTTDYETAGRSSSTRIRRPGCRRSCRARSRCRAT
jgi:hypothetical protein